MKKWIVLLVLLTASAAAAINFHLKFTDVHDASAGGGYNFYVRQGPTPWAQVTPINLFVPPMPTPGVHDQDLLINLSPGPFDCAITAYITGGVESDFSNTLSGAIDTPTPTVTRTATVTMTSTTVPTRTATRTNTPRPTLAAPTFLSF